MMIHYWEANLCKCYDGSCVVVPSGGQCWHYPQLLHKVIVILPQYLIY